MAWYEKKANSSEGAANDSILDSIETVTMKDIFECSKCDFETEVEQEKTDHIENCIQKSIIASCGECVLTFDTESLLGEHVKLCHSTNFIDCNQCSLVFNHETQLDDHMRNYHELSTSNVSQLDNVNEEPRLEPGILCTICNERFDTELGMEWHVETVHDKVTKAAEDQPVTLSIPCKQCDEIFICDLDYEWHESTEHTTSSNQFISMNSVQPENTEIDSLIYRGNSCAVNCPKCGLVFESNSDFISHFKVHEQIRCDQCTSMFENTRSFITHLLEQHMNQEALLQCDQCDFTAVEDTLMANHIRQYHNLGYTHENMLNNQNELKLMVSELKSEVNVTLSTVLEDLNKLKHDNNVLQQELFIMRQKSETIRKNVSSSVESVINNTVVSVITDQSPNFHPQLPNSHDPVHNAEHSIHSDTAAKKAPVVKAPVVKAPVASREYSKQDSIVRKHPPNVHTKCGPALLDPESCKENVQKSMLVVGDSISSYMHLPTIEVATKMKVKSVKAFTAITDNERLHDKRSYREVITNELEKDNYDVLVIQAGAKDITNLPNHCQYDEIENLKEVVVESAENLLKIVTEAATNNPNLTKIVILKQIPRYDNFNTSPPGLKTSLSYLFNSTLDRLSSQYDLEGKLVIGDHSLSCNGAVRESRYKDTRSGRYNGIHLYGPSGSKAYTASVINILKSADLITSVVPKYYDEIVKILKNRRNYTSE